MKPLATTPFAHRFCLFILTLVFFSCTKEDVHLENGILPEAKQNSEFNFGSFHNSFLDVVDNHQDNWYQLDEGIRSEQMKSLLQEHAFDKLPYEEEEIIWALNQVDDWISVSLTDALEDLENQDLKWAFEQLNSFVYTSEDSNDYETQTQRVITSVSDKLNDEELEILEMAVQISISSFQYWEAYEADSSKISDKARHVIGGDVSGVVTGAIGGLISGGPGGALLGACLGAPLGSCYAAVEIIFW